MASAMNDEYSESKMPVPPKTVSPPKTVTEENTGRSKGKMASKIPAIRLLIRKLRMVTTIPSKKQNQKTISNM